jgi:hypothetical protein
VLDWVGWPWAMVLTVGLCSLPIFLNSGPLTSLDWPAWWSIAQSVKSEVAPGQKWFWGALWPDGNCGIVLGATYSVGIVLPWMLGQLFSVTVALKMAYLITLEALVLSGYRFARGFAPRLAACLVGMLILQSNLCLINGGMWYDSLSIAAAIFCGAMLNSFLETSRARYWALACCAMTFAVYCHPLGAILGSAAWLAAVGNSLWQRWRCAQPAPLLALMLLPLVCMLLAAPQLLAHLDNAVVAAADSFAIQQSEQAAGFAPNDADYHRLYILVVSLPGFALLWSRSRREFWMIVVGLSVGLSIYLQLLVFLPAWVPCRHELLAYAYRFAYVTDALQIILLGAAILWAMERARPRQSLRPSSPEASEQTSVGIAAGAARVRSWTPSLGAFALIVGFIAASEVLYTSIPHSTLGTLPLRGDLEDLCQWLQSNVDKEQTRVYYEDTLWTVDLLDSGAHAQLPKFQGGTHLFGLMAGRTQLQQINGFWAGDGDFCARYCGDGARIMSFSLGKKLDEPGIRASLKRLNCEYVVTCSHKGRMALDRLSWLKRVARFGQFDVFQLRGFVPAWAWAGGDLDRPLNVTKVSPTEYLVDARGGPESTLLVSLAYANRWRAYAGDSPLEVDSSLGLIQVHLGSSAADQVVLRYEIPRCRAIAGAMTGIVLCLLVCAWIWRRQAAPTPRPTSAAVSSCGVS